jgi:hypothetical protein
MQKLTHCTCPEDAEKPYICMKHEVYLCEDCLACQDPSGYCKHRTACPIWYLEKHPGQWGPQPEDPPNDSS